MVPCTAPQWPAGLLERGPPEDPSILLRGEAAIAGTRFVLTAVRVNPIWFGPDYRDDLDADVYAPYELPTLLDMVAELMSVSEASTVQLETGSYVLWMMPRGGEA